MRLSFALFVVLLPLGAADPSAAKAAARPKAAAPAALSIPAGAVEAEPGTFRFTDAQCKKWIYRKTPFGVARMEDKVTPAAPAENQQPVRAVEKGDMVHFERQGPFGVYQWDHKKSELTDAERGWLEQQKTKGAAPAGSK